MSKLSLHISEWLSPEVTYDFIEQTRPPVVKVFGDAGLDDVKIREAKRRSPATVFVGRVYFPDQRLERDETTPVDTVFTYDPVADAQNAFQQMQGIMAKMRGLINVWEGYNEVPIDTQATLTERERQKAKNFDAFTVEMARLMHSDGWQYAAYSFSTGNPVHVELWDLLLNGLRASDYLALHEYIAPDQTWSDFNLDMCNRYRTIDERIPSDARKPILISECGADYLGQQGYKGKINVQKYLSLLSGYDRELMRDPCVIGAMIYCYGSNASQWKTYDIGGDMARLLREYILATPTPPIEIVSPPEPARETPRELTPPLPPAPRVPGQLLVADILQLAQQATNKLSSGDAESARAILKESIVPWFYATAPQHSTDLTDAQAHTTARWFCEEAIRRIEAHKLDEARQNLNDNVFPWLRSPGPHALGILSVQSLERKKSPKKRAPQKPRKPKSRSLLLSADEPKSKPEK